MIYLNNNPLYAIGDTHGANNQITSEIKWHKLKNFNFIHVGDFGIGFLREKKERARLQFLNKFLRLRGCFLYVIRGNHDWKAYFDGRIINECSNIILLDDYSVLNWCDQNFLCVGGAISVDRLQRKAGVDWWEDEVFVYDETRIPDVKIDHMVCHTAPDFVHPIGFNGFVYGKIDKDPGLAKELPHERDQMGKLVNLIKENNDLKTFIYGHFHARNTDIIDGTKYRLCDCNEFVDFERI
jgi:predicted phosphodiesterase